jgi:hypothetical protein
MRFPREALYKIGGSVYLGYKSLKSASPGKRILKQPSATSPLFFDNLHFEHFDKCQPQIHLEMFVEMFAPMGRLSKKRGLVADGCSEMIVRPSEIFVWGSINVRLGAWDGICKGHRIIFMLR